MFSYLEMYIFSLSEPRPSIIQREYNFEFNCPNSEFDAGDLQECISNARLCPKDDIKLCDRPFKRIQGVAESNSLMNINMKMEGTLPYDMIFIQFTRQHLILKTPIAKINFKKKISFITNYEIHVQNELIYYTIAQPLVCLTTFITIDILV